MAEVMKKATRDSYGEALVELGQDNPNIVVFDADLAGATKTGVFKKAFPDRFFDCGIAEGNMMVAAAGVSTCGYIPMCPLFPALPCLQPAAPMSRFATALVIPTSMSRSARPMPVFPSVRMARPTSAMRTLP